VTKSDEQLWEELRQDQRDALAELATRFYRPLLHYGSRFTPDTDLVKDNIQELLLLIWQRRHQLAQPASVKFYLFKALRHRLFKDNARRDLFQATSDEYELPVDEVFSFIEVEQHQADVAQLTRLLGQLTDRQREILYLRYYENLSHDDIAELTGINRQSVANTLHRTLSKLRENWTLFLLLLLVNHKLLQAEGAGV
jgi:RNA polymerase sigma factor (sigma-70 family)